ncbi:hypothetical protein ACKU27_23260 [Sphingobium yanoikuyae]|uniref:hypothetical protein n=1 Tax=Sphingobium yanoikuyae TaxID=13690 RepID=UPI003B915A7A
MNDTRDTVMDVIHDRNLTDREWALVCHFHEELTDAEVKVRAHQGIGTTILIDGLFVVEQGGDRFLVRRGLYESEWPTGSLAQKFGKDHTAIMPFTLALATDLRREFPGLELLSAHFRMEVNDGEAAGAFPFNEAPPMSADMIAAGFKGGWSTSSFVRY